MFNTLYDFYRSPQWEKFREVVILERQNDHGETICEYCKQPIIKKYDIILHHITHLTLNNVNNYDISLNSQNIMIVHHKCHNILHNRLGNFVKKVYLIHGAPFSGKKSYVDNLATENDLIVDITRIYNSVNNFECKMLSTVVFNIYNLLIDTIKTRNGKWWRAYVIRNLPYKGDRERLQRELGAELIFIDTNKEDCLKRAKNKDDIKLVEDYFSKYYD